MDKTDELPVSHKDSPEHPLNRAKRAVSSEVRGLKRVVVKAGPDAPRRLRVPYRVGDQIPDAYWFSDNLDRTMRRDLQYFGIVAVE